MEAITRFVDNCDLVFIDLPILTECQLYARVIFRLSEFKKILCQVNCDKTEKVIRRGAIFRQGDRK